MARTNGIPVSPLKFDGWVRHLSDCAFLKRGMVRLYRLVVEKIAVRYLIKQGSIGQTFPCSGTLRQVFCIVQALVNEEIFRFLSQNL
jgi:hypothetical protein